MLGIYAPQDFQVSAGPDDAIARRKNLREDLLRRLVTEEEGTSVQTSMWDVHPLEVVLMSTQILKILRKMTAEAALGNSGIQHLDYAVNREDDNVTQQRNPGTRYATEAITRRAR